jgi:lysozyme
VIRISDNGTGFIQSVEGCILHPYHGRDDPPGVITIYTGHVVRPGDVFTNSKEDAAAYLRRDLSWVESWLHRNCVWSLGETNGRQHNYDALCSFVFNEGRVWSDLLALVNAEPAADLGALKKVWMSYTKANNVPGVLTFRRAKEWALYTTPDSPAGLTDDERTELLARIDESARQMAADFVT